MPTRGSAMDMKHHVAKLLSDQATLKEVLDATGAKPSDVLVWILGERYKRLEDWPHETKLGYCLASEPGFETFEDFEAAINEMRDPRDLRRCIGSLQAMLRILMEKHAQMAANKNDYE